MAQAVPLNEVPKDVSARKVASVYNPLKEDFIHKFDGEEQIVKKGEHGIFPENIAVHLAKHLAKRVVMTIAGEERAKLIKELDKNEQVTVSMKPYPRFDKRVGDVAKLLVSAVDNNKKVDGDTIRSAASEENARANTQTTLDDAKAPSGELADTTQPSVDEVVSDYDEMTQPALKKLANERNVEREDDKKPTLVAALVANDEK